MSQTKHRIITTGRRYQAKGTRSERLAKRTADNIVFDSQIEMNHYLNLKTLLNAKKIRKLQYHPIFTFVLKDPTGVEFEAGQYEADFAYIETGTKALSVEDVKAWEVHPRTGELRYITGGDYIWQKRLMRACFGIEVVEV